MLYYIAYDLVDPGRDYATLFQALAALGATRVLKSDWVIRRSGTTAEHIRNYLNQFMDANDRIVVTTMGDWATRNALANIGAL